MLGASTVAHTSRGSPSITALPPDEGVVPADVDSVRNGRSSSHDRVSGHASGNSDDSQMALTMDSVSPTDTPFAATALRIDDACALHPFSVHKLDAGPVRLMTIAHAFNYRMAVLRNGVKSAVRGGHSMGPTGGRDVSDCVHHGVGIAVFSGGFGELAWHIAECTFGYRAKHRT